jgi:hypothetical protein
MAQKSHIGKRFGSLSTVRFAINHPPRLGSRQTWKYGWNNSSENETPPKIDGSG